MIAPLPVTWREAKKRNQVDSIINECWKNPDAGYEVQPTDEWIVNNQQLDGGEPFDILEEDGYDNDMANQVQLRMKPSTYGEITQLGARQLFFAMDLMGMSLVENDESSPRGDAVHFFDLGSGTGKLVAQVALELPHGAITRVTGVELSPSRHESAIQAKEALQQLAQTRSIEETLSFDNSTKNDVIRNDHSSLFEESSSILRSASKMELLQADLFDVDLSTATHIYVASLCFPENLMHRLEERLLAVLSEQKQDESRNVLRGERNNERHSHNQPRKLQCVASLQPFPNHLGGIHPAIRFMEMSWTKPLGCAVYVYTFKEGCTSES